jgi:hypothetical protein
MYVLRVRPWRTKNRADERTPTMWSGQSPQQLPGSIWLRAYEGLSSALELPVVVATGLINLGLGMMGLMGGES